MAKKDKIPACVVSLKIGSSVGSPTKRMLRDIRETAIQCNAIRTMAEAWVMDAASTAINHALGNAKGMDRVKQRDELIRTKKLSELVVMKRLYNPEMVGLFPGVSSALVSACCQDVVQRLASKMPDAGRTAPLQAE